MQKSEIDPSKFRIAKERFYYVLVILLSIAGWVWIFYSVYKDIAAPSVPEEIPSPADIYKLISGLSAPVFLLLVFFFSVFSHLLAMAFIRMNGVRVGVRQFPTIYEGVGRLSARLGIKKQPDTFVINGEGVLNAFATRLVFRRLLVVYSNLAEALIDGKNQKELEAVLGHELGHHALGHTHVLQWFLFPGMLAPFLGNALSRAREYSCDRIMKALIVEQEPCERALVKLAAGGLLGKSANLDVFVDQIRQERGYFAWLAEVLSTHPHLPKRIAALRQ